VLAGMTNKRKRIEYALDHLPRKAARTRAGEAERSALTAPSTAAC